jgi:N-acetylmuramoyl-L-alanine amidase
MLHHTGSTASEANIVNYLATNTAQVSCHYVVVGKNVYQIANDKKRTRHAGTGNYEGITAMNNHAIGIEVHSNGTVFDKDSKDATKELVQMLIERHNIPKEKVIRHLDYTNRKWDIGENFWRNEYKSYEEWQDSLVIVPRQKMIDL